MSTTPGIEPATFKKRDKSLKRCATVIRNSRLWYISMIVSAILSYRGLQSAASRLGRAPVPFCGFLGCGARLGRPLLARPDVPAD
jgi:hypothetical protein